MRTQRHLNFFRLFSAILLLVFLSGCATSVSQTWKNFRAYYNTYYNAKKNFRAGLKKINDQSRKINPETPVRIHPEPVQAGNSDFQDAIDKGAKILRKFPDSKYMDDALLLIGRSYYYRLEFYPALQKFEELQNASSDPKMKEQAIIWKGRTLLDLDNNAEGITYLESELEAYPNNGSIRYKGEIQSILGEHYALSSEWKSADSVLTLAVSNIKERQLKGRSYFLLGQVRERRNLYSRSFNAYSQVSQNFPSFEYVFWAGMKRADVARKDGNYKLALNIYQSLRRDDKNFERIDRIRFETARTMEMQGELELAEDQYKDLLYSDEGLTSRSLQGEVYYRLGKIYSGSREDFQLAAAYYDTASRYGISSQSTEGNESAQSLAVAYGKYNKLQDTVSRADSLLWLGSLSPEKLDSVLNEIRRRKRQQLLAQQQERSSERLKNQILPSGDEGNTSSSIYGFLNHRNNELVRQGKAEFRIIWGDRPLVDNWRRSEAIQSSTSQENSPSVARNNQREDSENLEKMAIDLDTDAIPKDEEQKRELKMQKLDTQYELGNLLFLTLHMYDSARPYFYRIINSDTETDLRPRAMYSLVELFRETGRQDSLQKWRSRILEEYPDTRYGRRIRGEDSGMVSEADSSSLREQYQKIIHSDSLNSPYRLRRLALENRSDDLAPYVHFQAISAYIDSAKKQRALSDSLFPEPVSLTASDSLGQGELDLNDIGLNKKEGLQFRNAYWDSVRFALQEYDTTFTNGAHREQVGSLLQMLNEADQPETDNLPTCEELGIEPEINPSRKAFLSNIDFPESQERTEQLLYEFTISKEGEVLDYELISGKASPDLLNSFEQAFNEKLAFKPFKGENIPEKVRCRISFPIRNN